MFNWNFSDNISVGRRLKWTAVPSQNLPGSTHSDKSGISNRELRLNSRKLRTCDNEQSEERSDKENDEPELTLEPTIIDEHCDCYDEEPDAEDIECAETLLELLKGQPNYNGPTSYRDFAVQVNTPKISTLCDLLTTDTYFFINFFIE